jgi:SAM-dependent methyltransferase
VPEYNRLQAESERRIITNWIQRSDCCLELGGGVGRITQALEPYFANLTMIDLSAPSLQSAKSVLGRTQLLRSDAAHIPVRDSSFDCVLMIKVVHLIPSPSKVFREILRVAKNHSTMIMSVPNLQLDSLIRGLYRISPSLRFILPTFGPSLWPLDRRPFLNPHRQIAPDSFVLRQKRGTGLFDNYPGKLLGRFRGLHLIDVATSPAWFLKPDILLKFEIVK